MLRRSFRIGILLGLLGGAAAALVKAFQSSRPEPLPAAPAWTPIPEAEPLRVPTPAPAASPTPTPTPAPAPAPVAPKADTSTLAALQEQPATPKKAPAKKAAAPKPKKLDPWVQPVDGACPGTHPVKGKLTSKIFHVPGGFNYARTAPDRCYIDAAAAEADGLRQSKR